MNLLESVNNSALSYFRLRGYTSKDLQELGQEIDRYRLAMRVDVDPNHGVNFTASTKAGKAGEGHVRACANLIKKALEAWKGEPMRGSFIWWLEDGMWDYNSAYSLSAPILAFCRSRSDSQTFLVPDAAYLGSEGYREDILRNHTFELNYPWERKQATAFWRGAGSGGLMNHDRWLETPRIQLCVKAKEIDDHEKVNAAISKVITFKEKDKTQRVYDLGVVGNYTPFTEFLRYKYQIDIDGECCAWISFFQKLCSQSVVLKVKSDYMQWYYELLKPWEHYVPLSAGAENISEIIDLLREEDEAAKTISSNAQQVMSSITWERSLEELGILISEVLKCQRDT